MFKRLGGRYDMIRVGFYGYEVTRDTLEEAQAVMAVAEEKLEEGSLEEWFYAGCPVGDGTGCE